MTDGFPTIHEALWAARRKKKLTQSELARQARCHQSAISMFESGRADVLSQEKLAEVARILGVDLQAFETGAAAAGAAEPAVLKYCPVEDCPSHFPYLVRGELCYRPRMVAAPPAERTRCGACGEFLEHTCPDEDCGAAVNDNSFCTRCGTAYVTPTRRERGAALAAWVERRRQAIRELRIAGGAEGAPPALPAEDTERPAPRRGRSEES